MSTATDRAAFLARRGELVDAIRDACRSRGDSRQHYEACVRETLDEPQGTWDWWLDYWRGQYKARRVMP